MPSSSLATYSVRVRYKGKRQTEPLGSFGAAEERDGHDLMPILNGYLEELAEDAAVDEDRQKLLQVTVINLNEDDREITGVVDHGEWGVAVPGKDRQTGLIHYQRALDDVEPFPFYYLFSLPAENLMGFAILQRFGNLGIRSQLLDHFQKRFVEDYPAFRLSIEIAAPGELLDQFVAQGAAVKKIAFQNNRLPRNFEDRYGGREAAIKGAYSEYVIHAKRGGLPIFNMIRDAVLRGGQFRTQLINLAPHPSSKVKVSLEVGGTTRTVELSDIVSMRAYYEIDEHVQRGANGLPTFDSVDELAHALLAKQYEALGQ